MIKKTGKRLSYSKVVVLSVGEVTLKVFQVIQMKLKD